jgi:hypothetical protein
MHVEGVVTLVEAKLSVNLTSLTIEQVIGKRKKLLQDMIPSLEAAVRQGLAIEGLATAEGAEAVAVWLVNALNEEELSHDTEWYNVDTQFSSTVNAMLATRKEFDVGGARRAAALGRLSEERVAAYGFPPWAFTAEVVAEVTNLEDSDWHVRSTALEAIGNLSEEVLAVHGTAIAARLQDSQFFMRHMAVEVLGLHEAVLAQHTAAVAAKLEDSDAGVRKAAVEALGRHNAIFAPHTDAIRQMADADNDDDVRAAAKRIVRIRSESNQCVQMT